MSLQQYFRNVVLVIVFSVSVVPAEAQSVLWTIQEGEVNFLSDAPLEMIAAGSEELRGIIDLTNKTFAFAVNISSFEGFNSPLQRNHFNENYLESHRYPQTTFKGRIIEQLDLTQDSRYTIRAKGMLSVHGVERERIIKSEVVVNGGRMMIRSNFTLRLEEHDITIPRIVHQKIAEVIMVEVKGILTQMQTP